MQRVFYDFLVGVLGEGYFFYTTQPWLLVGFGLDVLGVLICMKNDSNGL